MMLISYLSFFFFFFFNDTATTEIYTLSLHDALPICKTGDDATMSVTVEGDWLVVRIRAPEIDAGTVTCHPHKGLVHVKGSGKTADGQDLTIHEELHVSGGDESRAEVTTEGDDLVIRMPRD